MEIEKELKGHVAEQWKNLFELKGLDPMVHLRLNYRLEMYYETAKNWKDISNTEFQMIEDLKLAILIDHSQHITHEAMMGTFDLAEAYRIVGNDDEALKYYQLILQICKVFGPDSIRKKTEVELGKLYLKNGNLRAAYEVWTGKEWTIMGDPFIPEQQNQTVINQYVWAVNYIWRHFPSWTMKHAREVLVRKYSWSIPNLYAIHSLMETGPIIEIGAGSGYWAYVLSNNGVDIKAYDTAPPGSSMNVWGHKTKWFEVEEGGPEKIKEHPDRTLLLCWPPRFGNMASRCLAEYDGKWFFYVGESSGKLTGDEAFHEELIKNWEFEGRITLPSWPCNVNPDALYQYRRK